MASSRLISVAAIQAPFGDADVAANISRAAALVEQAARQKAQVILLPELFEGPYFCKTEDAEFFARARSAAAHPTLEKMAALARALKVVLPVSFFEQDGPHYYNSLAMIDADGKILGVYRKSHIPDGPGYEEKYYFRPGNTGFKAWKTHYGCIGAGICWDQWFPEAARSMMLQGAEVLLYPTAIGSEPTAPELDTKDPWQRAMVGHAVSNVVPVVAANRVGNEAGQIFYGSSFIADNTGAKVAELDRGETGIINATFDLQLIAQERAAFGFFRDRRPDLYGPLINL